MATERGNYPGYSRSELEAIALKFYKTCKPKEYRQMKRDGELQEVCQMKAKAAERLAKSMIAQGTFEGQAWPWAVRMAILEREPD